MRAAGKQVIKNFLGQIPFTAELYWLLRQNGRPIQTRFTLKRLQAELPEMVVQATELRKTAGPGKKVFIFATLHYWIEHTTLLGMSLAAQGHNVTLGYLPYAEWREKINRFDLRRQNVYTRRVLEQARPLIEPVSFLPARPSMVRLPEAVMEAVRLVTSYDAQYPAGGGRGPGERDLPIAA
jgi:hypothetical protein